LERRIAAWPTELLLRHAGRFRRAVATDVLAVVLGVVILTFHDRSSTVLGTVAIVVGVFTFFSGLRMRAAVKRELARRNGT